MDFIKELKQKWNIFAFLYLLTALVTVISGVHNSKFFGGTSVVETTDILWSFATVILWSASFISLIFRSKKTMAVSIGITAVLLTGLILGAWTMSPLTIIFVAFVAPLAAFFHFEYNVVLIVYAGAFLLIWCSTFAKLKLMKK